MNKLKMILCVCMVSLAFYAQSQQNPVNANANQKTKNTLSYLYSLKGSDGNILSGQESMYWHWIGDNGTPKISSIDRYIHQRTGKYPAIYSSDFGDFDINNNQPTEAACNERRDDVVNAIKDYAGRGALITMSYHMRPATVGVCAPYNSIKNPQDASGNHIPLTDAQIDQMITPGTAQYNTMIERFDQIADYFKELENDDITVLWRPFHEMNGGWFWWGQLSPSKYIALWNMMYDRLTYHHGCNNLLWVWSVNYYSENENPSVYYPGDSKVDILGADIYEGFGHSYAQYIYNDLNSWGGGKPIAFTENGRMPDVSTIKNTMPDVVYWLTWYTHHDAGTNPDYLYQNNYSDPYTITLDELPDFQSCPPAGTSCNDGNPNTINDMQDGNCNCAGTPIQTNDCELLTNGGFDSNVSNWTTWECTTFSTNGIANITNINAGANSWNAGFKQDGLILEQGKSYTITLRARADNNRPVTLKSGLAVAPWTAYFREDLNLTTSMQTYSYTFTMNSTTNANATFEFMFGTSSANLYIEYASVEEDNCGGNNCPAAGTSCDDGNAATYNDTEDGNCNCTGTPCPSAGTSCDDGNAATYNDVQDGYCNCTGTPCPSAGTSCNDGNPNTINDVEDGFCNCAGTPVENNDCELLSNESFDNGINNWYPWGCTVTPTNGTVSVMNITVSANTWSAGFNQKGITLEQGKNYTLTFRARADVNNRLLAVKSGLAVAPWTAYFREDLNLTTSIQTYEYEFTMNNATDTDASFEFMFGTNAAYIYIESASIQESDCGENNCPAAGTACDDGNAATYNDVEDGNCNCTGTPCPSAGTSCNDGNSNTTNDVEDGYCNCAGTPVSTNCELITNGTFDDNLEPWDSWGCSPSANYGWAYISGLSQSGGNAWDAGFSHKNLRLEQGKTYIISFDAYGDNRNFDVKAGLGLAPYTSYHYETVSVNWTGQTFTMTFTMNAPTTTQGALEFFFGNESGDVGLDNISLKESGCNNKEATPEPSHLIYPNPFSDKTNIEFDVPEDGAVSIFISDITGKRVATLADNEPMFAGTHQSVFDGQRLSSGVYYCTVITGSYRSVQKMILAK